MRILCGCEESQVVCKAFRALGHEAYSCDTQDCSGGKPEWHLKMDVFKAIKLIKPDMGIFFPPCTFLTYAGMGNWYDKGRAMKRIKAAEFFMRLWEAPIERICIENPQGIMNKIFRQPDQVIHPYYFGEPEMKRTCFWLKNLPKLEYKLADDLFGGKTAASGSFSSGHCIRKSGMYAGRKFNYRFVHGKNAKQKSKTFESVGKAMAEQWGSL